jgi:hypothetical protein
VPNNSQGDSRWRNDFALFDPEASQPIDLLALLQFQPQLTSIQVLVGTKEPLPLRLVALRLPSHLAAQRRRRARANAKRDRALRPSARYLKLLDWTILLSNQRTMLPASAFPCPERTRRSGRSPRDTHAAVYNLAQSPKIGGREEGEGGNRYEQQRNQEQILDQARQVNVPFQLHRSANSGFNFEKPFCLHLLAKERLLRFGEIDDLLGGHRIAGGWS